MDELLNEAVRSFQAGEYDRAENTLRQALDDEAGNGNARHLLGLVLIQKGDLDGAIDQLMTAASQAPDDKVEMNLAKTLVTAERFDEAVERLQRVIARNPSHHDAQELLGTALRKTGQLKEAERAYLDALKRAPENDQAYLGLAEVYAAGGRVDFAERTLRTLLERVPDHIGGRIALGNLLFHHGRLEQAEQVFREAISVMPDSGDLHYNLGNVLMAELKLSEAQAAFRAAIARNADHAEAHAHLGFAHLLRGEFASGWSEYAWRTRAADFPRVPSLDYPMWSGRPTKAGTILLRAEQGYGDTLQFVRYAPMVADRGFRVVLEAPEVLLDLMQTVPGIDRVVERGGELPPADCQALLMDLPRLFGTTLVTVPADVPYMSVPVDRKRRWRERLGECDRPRIGINWRGNRRHVNDQNRSMSLDYLQPVLTRDAWTICSIQKDVPGHERPLPEGWVDLAPDIHDFADLGAAMSCLDLVISVDTAPAHLAGALGLPVWTLLPWAPEWRWLLEREDTPWYPTMQLFRQPTRGNWGDVVTRVVEELERKFRQD